MNNTVFNIGNFLGQTGGNRVIRLITLGTPHHGSIAANGTTSDGCLLEESEPWSKDYVAWGIFKWFNIDINGNIITNIGDPNRNDLLWDNFNGSISDCSNINLEKNQLLSSNNIKKTTFDQKIIAYGGALLLDSERPSLASFVHIEGLPMTSICGAILLAQRNYAYDREFWLCSSALMFEGLTNPEDYGLNDGIVPMQSFTPLAAAGVRGGGQRAGRR